MIGDKLDINLEPTQFQQASPELLRPPLNFGQKD